MVNKVRKIYWKVFLTLFCLFVPFFGLQQAQAASGSAISLQPYIADNQIENTGYFYVKVTPGQVQTMGVNIINKGDKDAEVAVEPYTAYTNESGAIAYDKAKIPRDNTLKVKFRDITKPKKQTVKVPAGGQAFVDFEVTVPDTAFKGLVSGGFQAHVVDADKDVSYKSGTTAVINTYSFGMAAILREDMSHVTPNLRLNTVKAGMSSGNIGVLANIQNFKPAIVSGMSVETRITRKGSSKTVKSSKNKLQSMSPNSNYNYFTNWGKTPLEAGDYTIYFTGTMSGVQSWKLKKDFTITTAEANKYNDKMGFKRDYTWLYILIGVVVLILILLFGYLVGRKKNGNNNTPTPTPNVSDKRPRSRSAARNKK